MALHHFDPDADPTKVSAFLAEHGYAIVDDVASTDLMDRLAAEAEPWVGSSDAGRDEYDGRFTRRTGSLIERCPTSRELVMHPMIVGVVGHFLGHATTQQLHLTQLISVGPGERSRSHIAIRWRSTPDVSASRVTIACSMRRRVPTTPQPVGRAA